MRKTADAAKGKWRGILKELGIDEQYLVNKHGPCPVCGGADRFRFDDRDGTGSFYCNSCGPGKGMELAVRFTGRDFKDVASEIDKIVGGVDADPPVFVERMSEAEKRDSLNRNWAQAKQDEVLVDYLDRRGFGSRAGIALEGVKTLRGTRHLWRKSSGKREAGVLGLMQDLSGKAVTLQRIFVSNEREKKLMSPVAPLSGAAVRLGGPAGDLTQGSLVVKLRVAEGIESGLAVRCLRPYATVWCGVTANGMAEMKLPPDIGVLEIWADSDESMTGQSAAFNLAHRYARQNRDCKISVMVPEERGKDPLDLFIEGKEPIVL